jgi:ABC-type glycerol-3-phosphate transport system substrate-binding protein
MKRFSITTLCVTGFLLAALVCSVCSCSSTGTTARITQYAGTSPQPPTQPANVRILRFEPTQPSQQLGEIVVNIPPNTPQSSAEVNNMLREEAAKIGADAVVVVDDRIQVEGETVSVGWFTNYEPVTGERVVAKAFKYQTLSATGR